MVGRERSNDSGESWVSCAISLAKIHIIGNFFSADKNFPFVFVFFFVFCFFFFFRFWFSGVWDSLTSMVSRLVSLGADVNVVEIPDHEITENEGSTPLMKAVYNGHADVCKVLLAAGADVNLKEVGTGRTALHRAALQGFAHIVQILIDGGANVKGEDGATALNVASMFGHTDVEKVLQDAGAVRHLTKQRRLPKGAEGENKADFNMMDMSEFDLFFFCVWLSPGLRSCVIFYSIVFR